MLKQRKGTKMPGKRSSKGGVFSWILAVVVVSVAAIGVGWIIGQQVLKFMNPAEDLQQTADTNDSGYTYYPWSNDDSLATSTDANSGNTNTTVNSSGSEGTSGTTLYKVRVGSFDSKIEAVEISKELEAQGLPVMVTAAPPYSIQVGAFSSKDNAVNLSNKLNSEGYDAIVIE